MKRLIVILTIIHLLTGFCCLAEEYVNVQDRDQDSNQFGPRIDATMALMFDGFTGRNQSYLYGGRGKDVSGNEIFMDSHGDVWFAFHWDAYFSGKQNAEVSWFKCSTDDFYLKTRTAPGVFSLQTDSDYPPMPRYGHSGVICTALDNSILHWTAADTQQETYMNYLVFGGMKQAVRDYTDLTIQNNEVLTDELYVLAEYKILLENGMQTRHHWYKVAREGNETWPSPRKFAQIVPLFNEQDPPDERNKFLLFGGLGEDSGGNPTICNDAFVGTFTRSTTAPEATANEWEFTVDIDVDFDLVDISSSAPVSVYGGQAVYDPYFYHPSGSTDPIPRVIVIGGISDYALQTHRSNVYSLTQDTNVSPIDWTDIIVDENILPGMSDIEPGHQRAFFSASMNYREGKVHVVGGENATSTLNEYGFLSLVYPLGWSFTDGASGGSGFPNVSHHCSTYSYGNTVFCTENWNSASLTPERKLYSDRSQQGIPKEWNVKKSARNGLDNPEAVTNTRRLGRGDTVYIHQDNDYSGAVNDAYKCQIHIQGRTSGVTLEGKVKNGVKPVLYQNYASSQNYIPQQYNPEPESTDFIRDNTTIIFAHNKIKMKNLRLCHFETDITDPQTPMPSTIPSAKLANYASGQLGTNWDLAAHHNDDSAIFMHSESIIDSCDFMLNSVGISMICVSSAGNSAEIRNCTFEDNFMGIVALEKDHLIRYNRFEHNYLTGIAFDKGARTVACENMFIDNGHLDSSYGLDKYRSGILSDFSMTSRVPLIQTPFIYNNTFVDNYRALSVTEFVYRGQFMNRPVFFNNIIDNETAQKPSIFIADQGDRCDIISLNNCFNLPGSTDVIKLESSTMHGIVTCDHLEDDPCLFPGSYSLNSNSPCINAGLHLLEPGITSAMNYPDFGRLDIGYHYPLYTGNIPEAPTNVRIEQDNQIHWDPPVTAPHDYILVLYLDNHRYSSVVVPQSSSPSYTYDGPETHLWFGVMSRNNQQLYSECVWLEWSE